MADQQKELKVILTSDTKQAEQGLSGFGGVLKNIGTIAAGIGLERIMEKFVDFGKQLAVDSVKEYEDNQNSLAQLDAVLKSTGNTVGMTRDQLVELSKAMQDQTTFSHDAVLETEDLLLTFTNIGKDTFPQATSAVLDMSTALKEDTKSAAIQLGKALQDPILGMTALRRVGVSFTEDQKATVKQLVATGHTLDAQNLILKEINKEFGGSATAAANTYQGKLKQLNNSFGEIKEGMGKMIVEAIVPFVNAVAPFVKLIGQIIEGEKTWGQMMDQLNAKYPVLAGAINSIVNVYNNMKKIVDGVLKFINDLWNAHKDEIMAVLNVLGPQIKALWDSIKVYINDQIELIKIIVTAALWLIKTAWDVFGAGIIQSLKGTVEMIIGIVKLFFDTWTNIFQFFKDLFTGNWKALWGDVKKIFSDIFNDIKAIFKGFEDFAMGIINGIINGIKSAVNAISGAGNNTSKKALGGYGSGLTLVGEEGPELINLPAGSYVHTAKETAGIIGGGSGTTVNIYNPSVRNDNDITQLVAQIKKALGRENELARYGML